MTRDDDELETECEDAVFEVCCAREKYPLRCANQLEKYLSLKTNNLTSQTLASADSIFKVPIITVEQEELYCKFDVPIKGKSQTNSKSEVKTILHKLKDLKCVIKQIEKSKGSEINQLLKE